MTKATPEMCCLKKEQKDTRVRFNYIYLKIPNQCSGSP